MNAENFLNIWHLITRLGEAQIVLPAAALTVSALLIRSSTRRLALSWLLLITAAALITTASKVAFIGWGIGWAAVDFTGVSGHAMFAAAVYPMLMLAMVADRSPSRYRFASFALGCALALAVGLSRIAVGAHSWSEVVAGLLVGGAVSAAALVVAKSATLTMRPLVSAAVFAWLAAAPFQLQALQTHALVTRLAVTMSGNAAPFRRSELARRLRRIHLTAHPGA